MAVVLAICCCLSAVSGQWLEKTIALSDSFGDMWPAAVYYVPGSNCVYVAGEDDGVIVVDAATNARVARIDMDEPMFMAFDSHDNKVYMSGRESLSVIDPMTHQVLARLIVGSNPTRLCYNPAANKVYCLTGSRRDTVAVVDCSTNSVLARIWVGRTYYDHASVCCNPVGNKVYVPSDDEGTVAVIDGAGDSLLKYVNVGDYSVGLVYCPVSNKVYCADYDDEEVAVIDAGPDTLLKLIELDMHPVALGYNPVSNKVYCGDAAGYVHVIDCNTDSILASLGPIPGDPAFFLFDSVDNRIFCFPDYYTSIPAISGSGDSIVGWVTFHGDVYDPDPACYIPQQNRLYIRGRSSADVAVVDAAGCELVAALPMSFAPLLGCYIEPHDKLYCSDDRSGLITVIDCSTDSMERKILTPASHLRSPVYSSGSDKLYYGAWLGNDYVLQVVDCAHDSFEAMLPLNFDDEPAIVYNPTMDRIYWISAWPESTITVMDCADDSVVAQVPVGQNLAGLTCNPDSNRVYCAFYRADSLFISAIDCAADTVMGTVLVRTGRYASTRQMCYIPSQDVVCCTTGDTIIALVDGAARYLAGYIRLGGSPRRLELDPTSNRLYCLVNSEDLAVIDCRDMSIKAEIRLAAGLNDIAFDSIAGRVYATSPDFGCISLVDGWAGRFLGLLEVGESPGDMTWVAQHRRMYVADADGQAILVLRDTAVAGVNGEQSPVTSFSIATLVRGVLHLAEASSPKPQAASLLDAVGRRVMDLRPGANDVRHLVPGVYFVHEGGGRREQRGARIRKVVVTK